MHPVPLAVLDGRRGIAQLLPPTGFDYGDAAEISLRADHLALSPEAAQEASSGLGEGTWWATLADVSDRTRLVTAVRSWLEGETLVLLSDEDVPGLQLVFGEPPGHPCLMSQESPVGRLARGRLPGTFALDLKAGIEARVAWRPDRVPHLRPSPVESRDRPGEASAIRERVEAAVRARRQD